MIGHSGDSGEVLTKHVDKHVEGFGSGERIIGFAEEVVPRTVLEIDLLEDCWFAVTADDPTG